MLMFLTDIVIGVREARYPSMAGLSRPTLVIMDMMFRLLAFWSSSYWYLYVYIISRGDCLRL